MTKKFAYLPSIWSANKGRLGLPGLVNLCADLDWNLFSDIPALLARDVVTLLLGVEVGDLLDCVHALLLLDWGAGQVRGGGKHVETLNFGNIVTFWHWNFFWYYYGYFLASFS